MPGITPDAFMYVTSFKLLSLVQEINPVEMISVIVFPAADGS